MAEDFNFDMATKYKPEFKKQATLQNLGEILAKERIKNEGVNPKDDEVYFDREIARVADSKEPSSIKNKLKRLLNLNVVLYANKGDEEKYNVLKLYHYIVNTNRYQGKDGASIDKTISIIDLISNHSLEHTGSDYSLYKEHFTNCKEEIEKAVDDHDEREQTITWIHGQWNYIRAIIGNTLLLDKRMKCNDLVEFNMMLKYMIDSIDSNQIKALQRTNEGVIETFYNMLLSSCVVAEIEDMQKVVFDYQKEETVPEEITELFLSKLLSEPVTWQEFKELTKINKKSLSDEKKKLIWSILLKKQDVTDKDLDAIDPKAYRFAQKYTEAIAEYWVHEYLRSDTIALDKWIIVMQELMYIHQIEIKYPNSYIRHTNSNAALTASVKHFEESNQLPHQIILQRLSNRYLLTFGTRDVFNNKLEADSYINDLEKIIFSYQNIEDIKLAHNHLYFKIFTLLSSYQSCVELHEAFNDVMKKHLAAQELPLVTLGYLNESTKYYFCYYPFLHMLVQDYCCRLNDNEQFISYRKEAFEALANGFAATFAFVISHPRITRPECAYETLAQLFADELKSMLADRTSKYSQPITTTIYYGKNDEYTINVRFELFPENNMITITDWQFAKKGTKYDDTYETLLKDLLLLK